MSREAPIAPAIALRQPEQLVDKYDGDHSADAVVNQIYVQLDRMLQYESRVQGSWLVQVVSTYFCPSLMAEPDVDPGQVSWYLWEEINAGRIDIDKYGGVTRGTAAPV